MKTILLVAHIFIPRSINAYRFARVTRAEQLAEEFNFCRAGTGDNLMKTPATFFSSGKTLHRRNNWPVTCHAKRVSRFEYNGMIEANQIDDIDWKNERK